MFDKKISILVPYKSDKGLRDRNWFWIKKRYKKLMPNAELCIGQYNDEPFSRSAAINNAAKLATRDIFLIVDADIAFDIKQIKRAMEGLRYFAWVVPYTSIDYLTFKQTSKLIEQDPSITLGSIDFTGSSKLIATNIYGAINIIPRKYFEIVRGFDEQFKGWGEEDHAFGRVVDTICGEHVRLDTRLWHLHHPPASRIHCEKNTERLDRFYKDKKSILRNFNEGFKN
jgi:predicted glycosyltransferase involved in capsule biosynthesis